MWLSEIIRTEKIVSFITSSDFHRQGKSSRCLRIFDVSLI